MQAQLVRTNNVRRRLWKRCRRTFPRISRSTDMPPSWFFTSISSTSGVAVLSPQNHFAPLLNFDFGVCCSSFGTGFWMFVSPEISENPATNTCKWKSKAYQIVEGIRIILSNTSKGISYVHQCVTNCSLQKLEPRGCMLFG